MIFTPALDQIFFWKMMKNSRDEFNNVSSRTSKDVSLLSKKIIPYDIKMIVKKRKEERGALAMYLFHLSFNRFVAILLLLGISFGTHNKFLPSHWSFVFLPVTLRLITLQRWRFHFTGV